MSDRIIRESWRGIVRISIVGHNGAGVAEFNRGEWESLCPVERVLAIHEARRDLTAGQPFDVVRKTIDMGVAKVRLVEVTDE